MNRPCCYVCHRTRDDVPTEDGRRFFTLVYFGEVKREKPGSNWITAPFRRTRHSRNGVWFCEHHLAIAREHENRPLREALAAIKSRFQDGFLLIYHGCRVRRYRLVPVAEARPVE